MNGNNMLYPILFTDNVFPDVKIGNRGKERKVKKYWVSFKTFLTTDES